MNRLIIGIASQNINTKISATLPSINQLPGKMKALILKSTEKPPPVEIVPTPKPTVGSAVVHILVGPTTNFTRAIYTGKRKFLFPKPMIPGISAIARVVALGHDSTKIRSVDLGFFDYVVRSCDDPTDTYLSAVPFAFTEGAKILRDGFSNGAFAEYCRTPLENLTVFNEARLTGSPSQGGLGYGIEQLAFIARLLVPYEGLKDINLRAGQTVIIAPATGSFGG